MTLTSNPCNAAALVLVYPSNCVARTSIQLNFKQELPKVDLDVSTPGTASDRDGIYSNYLCRKITLDLFLSLDIPEEFRLENWPCLHDAGRDAIQIETNRVIHIPAYDFSAFFTCFAIYGQHL